MFVYSWQSRFQQTNSLSDLNEALKAMKEAVDSTARDHPYRSGYLNNLGIVLRSIFEQTGLMNDLHTAVKASEETVKLIPYGHLNRRIYLHNLAKTLRSSFCCDKCCGTCIA